MISRVESTRPPGVLISISNACALVSFGLREGAADELVGDGLDGVVDDDFENIGASVGDASPSIANKRVKKNRSQAQLHQLGSGGAFCASLGCDRASQGLGRGVGGFQLQCPIDAARGCVGFIVSQIEPRE